MAAALALPAGVVAALDLALLAVLTGGLHLDGLADTADGALGGANPARRLAIMRDSAVGAFGVAALVLVLLVSWSALASIPARSTALIATAVASRWAAALALARFPSARPDGLGHAVKAGVGGADVVLAGILTGLVLVAALGPLCGGLVLAGGAAVALALGAWLRVRLGGLTGDTYGAIAEISGALTFVGLAAAK